MIISCSFVFVCCMGFFFYPTISSDTIITLVCEFREQTKFQFHKTQRFLYHIFVLPASSGNKQDIRALQEWTQYTRLHFTLMNKILLKKSTIQENNRKWKKHINKNINRNWLREIQKKMKNEFLISKGKKHHKNQWGMI